jgi:Meiotically up-regulated gene 113
MLPRHHTTVLPHYHAAVLLYYHTTVPPLYQVTTHMPFVYFIQEEGDDPKVFKIGKTSQHPADRREQLQTGNPRKLIIYRWIETPTDNTIMHSTIEEGLHKEHAEAHIRGEWFYITRDVVDMACAMILSVYVETKVSADYPNWTEEDLIAVQQQRIIVGKYRGGASPRTARKKKKEYWAAKAQPMGFSDD